MSKAGDVFENPITGERAVVRSLDQKRIESHLGTLRGILETEPTATTG